MKIITMERKTLDGKLVEYGVGENGEDYRDYWCVIETEEEELVYDYSFGGVVGDSLGITPELFKGLWNKMVNHAGVSWGDDDIYGYIRPDEAVPDIKEEYLDGDSDIWIRVE